MANLLGRYLQRNARQELVDSFEGNETNPVKVVNCWTPTEE
jgi:hypothetical protein